MCMTTCKVYQGKSTIIFSFLKKIDVLVLHLFIYLFYFCTTIYISTYSKSSALSCGYQRKVIALSAAVRNENKNMHHFWGKSLARCLLY